MTTAQKIRWIAVINWGLSILYIVLMFVLGSSDSSFYDKSHTEIMRKCYGFLLFILGLRLLYLVVGKEGMHQIVRGVTYSSIKENILDEEEIDDTKIVVKGIARGDLIANFIHLSIAFFLLIGREIGCRYSVLMTIGFVYAMFWGIIGLFFLAEMKKEADKARRTI